MRYQISPYRTRSSWDLFKEFDDLFTQLRGTENERAPEQMPLFQPAVDIRENEKGYLMAIDLPGIPEKDVKIEVKEGMMTVTGERRRDLKDEKEGWTRTERSFGRFQRSFSLPKDVKPQEIEAQFENGELHLFLPKSEAAQAVQIPVKSTSKKEETGEVKGLMDRFFAAKEKEVKTEQKH